jgi:hypothetical protein
MNSINSVADIDNVQIDIESIRACNGSPPQASINNSIPIRLKRWYSHNSFKNIILGTLSIISVTSTIGLMMVDKLDSCTAYAFITSVILIFVPSPISQNK